MESSWKDYLATMSDEVGPEMAREFVGSLRDRAQSDAARAAALFDELGSAWTPLLQAWGNWIVANAEGRRIVMILRDAKPLGRLPISYCWQRIYLNRLNCGIPDELSGDATRQHLLLDRYLRENECDCEFAFVDSGCYGTIVKELHRFGVRFKPLFFFSKNSAIPGFVNELGLSEKEGEVLNDSLECAFPHAHRRPSELREVEGRISPVLTLADRLSVVFGEAAMHGIRPSARALAIPAAESAGKLLRRSEQARTGMFTGILPRASPEWSGKADFLREWPPDLRWT